jgi:hypothetical protein
MGRNDFFHLYRKLLYIQSGNPAIPALSQISICAVSSPVPPCLDSIGKLYTSDRRIIEKGLKTTLPWTSPSLNLYNAKPRAQFPRFNSSRFTLFKIFEHVKSRHLPALTTLRMLTFNPNSRPSAGCRCGTTRETA